MAPRILILYLAIIIALCPFFSILASTQEDVSAEIERRNQQIAELQVQIDKLNNDLGQKKDTANTVQSEINRLTSEIKKSELEIKSLSVAIGSLSLQIKQTEEKIAETSVKMEKTKNDLSATLGKLNNSEQLTPLELIVSKPKLSTVFTDLYDLYFLQASIKGRVSDLKEDKKTLEESEEELSNALKDREGLKTLEELTRQRSAAQTAKQKQVLSQVKKEQTKIADKIKMTQLDLSRIKDEITYLIKAGISVEDAVRYGQLAAIRLGIRPAFLIAILEVESRLGLNVGKGTWKKDMHPRDHGAFAAICSKLNLDPDKTPVSRKPSYGWGGAMGPAQFLPTTWLAYESEVARLTGHKPPSPWNIEDAFTAAAIKLAGQGAAKKTRAGEIGAAKAYIGGSPSCSKAICNSYANAVLDKAEELEQQLGS